MVPFRFCSRLQVLLIFLCAPGLLAQTAFVRVNQAGYEAGNAPLRAYLMSQTALTNETFEVVNLKGDIAHTGHIGTLLGTWGHSKKVSYNVYALDFNVPSGDLYTILVPNNVANNASGTAPLGNALLTSPAFAVDSAENLYSGLLLNT